MNKLDKLGRGKTQKVGWNRQYRPMESMTDKKKKSVIKLDCPPCRWGSRVYNALPRTALK